MENTGCGIAQPGEQLPIQLILLRTQDRHWRYPVSFHEDVFFLKVMLTIVSPTPLEYLALFVVGSITGPNI